MRCRVHGGRFGVGVGLGRWKDGGGDDGDGGKRNVRCGVGRWGRNDGRGATVAHSGNAGRIERRLNGNALHDGQVLRGGLWH